MKISPHLSGMCQRSLIDSLSTEMMVHIARNVIPHYDLHERTGFPDSIPVPKKDAAAQILRDLRSEELMIPFINQLVSIHQHGHMGRDYPIMNIRTIIQEMYNMGYLYDQELKMFVENPKFSRSRNWGVLREGDEHAFTFLRLDIVGNSVLVREHDDDVIQRTYADLRTIAENAIERRNGRIWNWEGDGGLAAFFFSNRNLHAMLSAMEIIHELFLYNSVRNRLNRKVSTRLSIHAGPCVYTTDPSILFKNETVKKTVEIESKHTKPDSVTISNTSNQHFDEIILRQFKPIIAGQNLRYYNYELRWED